MKKIAISASVITLLFGCAPAIPYNVKTSSESIFQKPPQGKANVIFVRASHKISGMPFTLHDGEKVIGVVKGKNCALYTAAPGKHIFDAFIKKGTGADGRDRYMFIDADLAADKIYYILVRPYIILFAGAFTDLEPIRSGNENWNNLPDWLAECSVTEVNEDTISWDEQISAKNKKIRIIDDEGWRRKNTERERKAIKPNDGVSSPVNPGK